MTAAQETMLDRLTNKQQFVNHITRGREHAAALPTSMLASPKSWSGLHMERCLEAVGVPSTMIHFRAIAMAAVTCMRTAS